MKLAMLVALFAACVAGDIWLFDGCPDIQRIRDYPTWLQTSLSTLYWPVAGVGLLVVGGLLFWRRVRPIASD